jgi:polyphosphate kinase
VVSIVGRFLEHSRIYWFENAGVSDALIGSADIMRRNLDRRIEVLVPVSNPKLQAHIRSNILETCLQDGSKSWLLKPDGTYERIKNSKRPLSAQGWFMRNPSTKAQFGSR